MSMDKTTVAGFCLALLGLIVEFVGWNAGDNAFFAGIALSVVGLAVFARSRGHSVVCSVCGLIPLLGPLIGLLFLIQNPSKTSTRRISCRGSLLKVLFVIALFIGLSVGLLEWSHREVTAFYASAKGGVLLVDALEQHPKWFSIYFGEQFIDESGSNHVITGRDACGSVWNIRGKGLRFNPDPVAPPADPDRNQKNYSSVRELFRDNTQLFARCSWVYVTYPAFMFERGRVVVQIDAQGKIMLAKEPYYWD